MPSLRGSTSRASIRKSDSDSGVRLLVACVALSLVMFTLSARESGSGFFTSMRGAFSTVTMPVRYVGAAASVPFQGLGNVFANLTADQQTLSELRQENERLTARNTELEEAEQTAARLQDLLALQSTYSLQSTAARIISGSSDSWTDTVTLDKGSSAGLSVGMPVTDSSGAIGQIIECGTTSSVVRLITDENSGVSAMVHLGKVISVNKAAGALYYDIDVSPLSSTEGFEEVLVITSLTEGQEATSDDIAAADAQETSSIVGGSAPSSSDATSSEESSEGDAGTSE